MVDTLDAAVSVGIGLSCWRLHERSAVFKRDMKGTTCLDIFDRGSCETAVEGVLFLHGHRYGNLGQGNYRTSARVDACGGGDIVWIIGVDGASSALERGYEAKHACEGIGSTITCSGRKEKSRGRTHIHR